MLRPQTPSLTSSLALERPDDSTMDTEPTTDAPAMLESVVHLHELPVSFAYAYFERESQSAQVSTPSGAVVFNEMPVRPRVVECDAIVWKPVLSTDGLSGHRFDLLFDGETQAHMEVFCSQTAIQRVALVHRLYTPTARAAGLVDRNSLLEFNSPESHHAKLTHFLTSMPTGSLYLPVNELAVGSALHADTGVALQLDPRHTRNPVSASAEAVWLRTKQELGEIARVAMQASSSHNASEFGRCGLS